MTSLIRTISNYINFISPLRVFFCDVFGFLKYLELYKEGKKLLAKNNLIKTNNYDKHLRKHTKNSKQ